jgi:hypothetical protein
MIKIIAIIGFLIFLMVVVPLVFFFPLLGAGRFMLSLPKEKDKMSLTIVSTVSILWTLMVYSIYPSIGSQNVLCGMVLLLFGVHFACKGIRDQGGYKEKTLRGKQIEFLNMAISEPWKTRYHWGSILQAIVILYSIVLQIIEK